MAVNILPQWRFVLAPNGSPTRAQPSVPLLSTTSGRLRALSNRVR